MWGVPDGAGLAWVDEPPAAAMAAARETLERLGLAGSNGVTPLGRAVAGLPAGVREARALVVTAPALGARRAARATALLTADLRAPGGGLTALARQGRGWRLYTSDPAADRRDWLSRRTRPLSEQET